MPTRNANRQLIVANDALSHLSYSPTAVGSTAFDFISFPAHTRTAAAAGDTPVSRHAVRDFSCKQLIPNPLAKY
jgi:hypothetical protein